MKMKKLSLRQVLQGIENLFDENGQKRFVARQVVFVPSVAKAAWIEQQLPVWKDTINQHAGVQVENITLHCPWAAPEENGNYSFARPTFCDGKADGYIIIECSIPGSILTNGMLQEIARPLIDGIEKYLAQELIRNFPPSFDFANPLFAAGHHDCLEIHGSSLYGLEWEEWSKREEQVVRRIDELVTEAGAQNLEIICGNTFCNYYKQIKWDRDVSDQQRKILGNKIRSLFKEVFNSEPIIYFGSW